MSEKPDFKHHPAWVDVTGNVRAADRIGEYDTSHDNTWGIGEAVRCAPWTPLDTAEGWAKCIDRDKLALTISAHRHGSTVAWKEDERLADAILAALPELMGEEEEV